MLLDSGQIWLAATTKSFAAHPPPAALPGSTLPDNDLLATLCIEPGSTYEWFVDRSANKRALLPLTVISSLARALVAKNDKQIIWVGQDSWPAPFFVNEELKNSLFVKPPDKKLRLWAIEMALRSTGVGAVIAECDSTSMKVSRRFALAAKKGGSIGFLICAKAIPSAARGRFQIVPTQTNSLNPTWHLTILKIKGQQPESIDWLLELKDNGLVVTDDKRVSIHIPIYKVG